MVQIPSDIATNIVLADQYFDIKGLCAYASLGESTLRHHIRDNDLPHYKLQGKILIRRSEFDQWIERYRRGGEDIAGMVNDLIQDLKGK